MFIQYMYSFIGWIEIVADNECLIKVDITKQRGEEVPNALTMLTVRWLHGYFNKNEPEWRPPMRFPTPFAQLVSGAVMEIPFGDVATYGQIAQRISRGNAARAVGGVMRKNPYLIIVPCHRIVAKNGLGGYRLGEGIKRKLLEFEGANR